MAERWTIMLTKCVTADGVEEWEARVYPPPESGLSVQHCSRGSIALTMGEARTHVSAKRSTKLKQEKQAEPPEAKLEDWMTILTEEKSQTGINWKAKVSPPEDFKLDTEEFEGSDVASIMDAVLCYIQTTVPPPKPDGIEEEAGFAP